MAELDPIDVFIGAKLRARRTMMGMSQEVLGQAVGVTFQQVQKYERGTNRIVVSRLYQFSKILNVPITYFFEGLDQALSPQKLAAQEDQASYDAEPLITKSGVELLKRFSLITDPAKRKIVSDLVRTFAQEFDEEEREAS